MPRRDTMPLRTRVASLGRPPPSSRFTTAPPGGSTAGWWYTRARARRHGGTAPGACSDARADQKHAVPAASCGQQSLAPTRPERIEPRASVFARRADPHHAHAAQAHGRGGYVRPAGARARAARTRAAGRRPDGDVGGGPRARVQNPPGNNGFRWQQRRGASARLSHSGPPGGALCATKKAPAAGSLMK